MFIPLIPIGQRLNQRLDFKPTENSCCPNTNKSTGLTLRTLNADVVSFGSNDDVEGLEKYLRDIPEKDWPPRVYKVARKIVDTVREEYRPTLTEVHHEIYGPLKNCKTLDEAKELYPEFSAVRQPNGNLPKEGRLYKMWMGEIEEPEGGITLYLLKYFYKQETLLEGYKRGDLQNFATTLKIPTLKPNYAKLLSNINPKYKKKRCDTLNKYWEKPENRQNPSLQATLAWEKCELAKKARAELFKNNPGMAYLLGKRCRGEELSEEEEAVLKKINYQVWDTEGTTKEWGLEQSTASLLIKQVEKEGLGCIDDPRILEIFLRYENMDKESKEQDCMTSS